MTREQEIKLPLCWIEKRIILENGEEKPAALATKQCEFRRTDTVIVDETFHCTHPNAKTAQNYSEFCEPYLRRSSRIKKK